MNLEKGSQLRQKTTRNKIFRETKRNKIRLNICAIKKIYYRMDFYTIIHLQLSDEAWKRHDDLHTFEFKETKVNSSISCLVAEA